MLISDMDRQIIYFQIPSFEIALARRQDAALCHQPVAIAPTHHPRACVREVSPEAYGDGLRPGMSVELARRLCPTVRLLPPDSARIGLAYREIQHIVAEFAPVCEPVQPGHLFLDLTGTHRLFGPVVDTAFRIEREIIRRQNLTGVVGIGTNKLVSHAAGTIVQPPQQLYEIRPGFEQSFLAPIPISLPCSIHKAFSRKSLALLEDLNLHTLGDIADIPLPHLQLVLGPGAALLHEWAHGFDPSPVLPPKQQICVERSHSVSPDEIDDDRLCGLLYGLLEQICRTLRQQQRVCGRLTLTIRHSDHVDVRKQQSIDPPTHWEADLYPPLTHLFSRCFQRRIRLCTMILSAEDLRVEAIPSSGEPAGKQLSLFDPDLPNAMQRPDRSHQLTLALDRIRDRFGEPAITWGCARHR
jgi:DNA polymerase-4